MYRIRNEYSGTGHFSAEDFFSQSDTVPQYYKGIHGRTTVQANRKEGGTKYVTKATQECLRSTLFRQRKQSLAQ